MLDSDTKKLAIKTLDLNAKGLDKLDGVLKDIEKIKDISITTSNQLDIHTEQIKNIDNELDNLGAKVERSKFLLRTFGFLNSWLFCCCCCCLNPTVHVEPVETTITKDNHNKIQNIQNIQNIPKNKKLNLVPNDKKKVYTEVNMDEVFFKKEYESQNIKYDNKLSQIDNGLDIIASISLDINSKLKEHNHILDPIADKTRVIGSEINEINLKTKQHL